MTLGKILKLHAKRRKVVPMECGVVTDIMNGILDIYLWNCKLVSTVINSLVHVDK